MSSSTDSVVNSRPQPTNSGGSEPSFRSQRHPDFPPSAALDRLEPGDSAGVWTWSRSDLRFLGAGLLISVGLLASQWGITAGLKPATVTVRRGQAEVPTRFRPEDPSHPRVLHSAATPLAAIMQPVPQPSSLFQIEMNEADWVAWSQLDGIGEKLAQRIIADRQQQGPFQSIDDLLRVKGIGPKTLARLRPHLRLSLTRASDGSSDSQ